MLGWAGWNLEAFDLMRYWEKQRNDETSWIDVCITTAMSFGLFDACSASIYFLFVSTTRFESGRSIYLFASYEADKSLILGQPDVS